MKALRTIALSILAVMLVGLGQNLWAQEVDEEQAIDTTSTALLYEWKYEFDVVFKGVKKGLEDAGYEVGYGSKRKMLVETKFKILADEDNFFDVMNLYGEVPYVRSPGWTTGRVQVKVDFEETEDGRTIIELRAKLSGFEGRFLNKWLYWNSNGKIEEAAMDAVIAAVEAEAASSL